MPSAKSLRDLISLYERYGEIERIKDWVDWKFEIGEYTNKVIQNSGHSPAILFENIKDYPGFYMLTNGLGNYGRIAITLGLEPEVSAEKIVKTFIERIKKPVGPELVDNGPVFENVFYGKDIDLYRLPSPWWHREDAGRYIGTWHINVTKDIDTGVRNIGVYRMQLLDKRRTAVSISPKSHLAIQLKKARDGKKPLPMAVAIGVDEVLVMAGACAVPYGIDEYNIAGGLRQSPVELVKCRTIDMEVPGNAEIVLEGYILPDGKIKEGPFVDYAGIPKGDPGAHGFEVTCLMYRNNPIFRGSLTGIPGGEDHLLYALLANAGYLDFHGSRIRQFVQNYLFKNELFKAGQYAGMIKQQLKNPFS